MSVDNWNTIERALGADDDADTSMPAVSDAGKRSNAAAPPTRQPPRFSMLRFASRCTDDADMHRSLWMRVEAVLRGSPEKEDRGESLPKVCFYKWPSATEEASKLPPPHHHHPRH